MRIMRALLLLSLFAAAWAAIKTHMALPVELGIEQIRENVETDIVTFYAFVRATENTDYRWILSFVNFTCDGSCAESTSNLCEPLPVLNPGWESRNYAFYPHEGDPPAMYIRRVLEIDGETACEDGLSWTFDDATSVAQLEGQLYLHTVQGCSETGCPQLIGSDVLPFSLSYNTDSGELTGLQRPRDMTYIYSIVGTKNLWLSGYDTLVQLTSNVQTLGDAEMVAVPIRFENPSIVTQSMQPSMRIIGLTDCTTNTEQAGCFQNWYLQAESGLAEPTPLSGKMEIVSDLVFSDGSIVQSLLHLNIDVQSAIDSDQVPRLVDTVTSVKGEPYFSGMLNPASIQRGDRICMSLSSPDRATLTPGAVRICASQKVDLVADVSELTGCRTPNIDDLAVYDILDISTGFYNASFNPTVEQSMENPHEFKVCFDAVALSDKMEVIEAYYSRTDVIATSSEFSKRQVDEMYVAQGVPIGCAYSESWDPVLCRCVPYYTTTCCDNDWDWFWIIFLVAVVLFIIIGLAVVCCWYPGYDSGTTYPCIIYDGPRSYWCTKDSSGAVHRTQIVSGTGNTVTYNSPDVEPTYTPPTPKSQ